MNKAFVREPDRTAEYCPRCGSKGEPVGRETLESHVPAEKLGSVADPANFCPSPPCEVAYFDGFERVVLTTDLRRPVYPKDPAAPICACFGLTREDIEQDVLEGVVTRTRAVLARAKSPEARCSQAAANGRPCVAFVQKYYMQCRAGGKE
jgi:hypothetical protein